MSSKTKLSAENITVGHYRNGDEAKIVEFLNLCFGQWGTVSKWQKSYAQYPTFDGDNVILLEKNGEIIAHNGLHFRDLVIGENHKILTAARGDGAVHPKYRGLRIHYKLVEITLQSMRAKGACLGFGWMLKGSTGYNNSKKMGFVEIRQPAAYMKVINPGKVFKSGLSDFVHKNQKMKNALQNLTGDLYFSTAETEFSIGELLGETGEQPRADGDRIRVIFDESCLSLITKFRTSSRLQRINSLVLLLLLRKIKIQFGSFSAFAKFIRRGVKVLVLL